MDEPKRDGSMHIRAAIRQELISRETALALCRMVLADIRGDEACRAQEPLTAEDGSNVWIVRGALEMKPDAIPGDPAPIQMSISKLDRDIVSFFG
jgi:hypothetical protein